MLPANEAFRIDTKLDDGSPAPETLSVLAQPVRLRVTVALRFKAVNMRPDFVTLGNGLAASTSTFKANRRQLLRKGPDRGLFYFLFFT